MKQWHSMNDTERIAYLREKIRLNGRGYSWSSTEWGWIKAHHLMPGLSFEEWIKKFTQLLANAERISLEKAESFLQKDNCEKDWQKGISPYVSFNENYG